MDALKEIQSDQELLVEISTVYDTNKKYFIMAEEILPQMQFFVAPLVEHRDALDHIMRYFSLSESNGDISQLEKALTHEIRAFFDVADYICINIRYVISRGLNKMSKKKIKNLWSDYLNQKERIYEISKQLADIRINRRGTFESVKQYIPHLESLFEMYKHYVYIISPRVKIGKREL